MQLVCHFVQVDLAGSENVGRSGAVDKRLREAGRKLFYQDFMNSLLIYLIFHHITQRAAVKEIESLRQKTETTLGMLCAESLAKRFDFLHAFIDRHNQSEFADAWKSDHITSRKSASHTLQVLSTCM